MPQRKKERERETETLCPKERKKETETEPAEGFTFTRPGATSEKVGLKSLPFTRTHHGGLQSMVTHLSPQDRAVGQGGWGFRSGGLFAG